jgi:hypothetical protein
MCLASLCLAASTLRPNANAFSATPTTTRVASSIGGRHCRDHGRKRAFRNVAATTATTTTTSLPAFGGVEPVDAWSAVDTFFRTQPETAAFLTCSFKASAADLLAQTQVDESSSTSASLPSSSCSSSSSLDTTKKSSDLSTPPRPTSTTRTQLVVQQQQQKVTTTVGSSWLGSSSSRIDISRNLGFLLYGGLYTGLAQHYLYNMVYPKIFESVPTGSWMLTLDMVIFDNLVAAPFLCLPVAYIFKTAFASESKDNSNDSKTQQQLGFNATELLTKGLKKYVADVTERGLLIKYWSIWLPVQFLTFGVIPEHFRVTFVALVSFFWIAILSAVSAEEDNSPILVIDGSEEDTQPKMV